jgi:hypothetical protein
MGKTPEFTRFLEKISPAFDGLILLFFRLKINHISICNNCEFLLVLGMDMKNTVQLITLQYHWLVRICTL